MTDDEQVTPLAAEVEQEVIAQTCARTMPRQKPGMSFQEYQTPEEFMIAVEDRFGSPDWDLAALDGNSWCDQRFGPGEDALVQDWRALKPCANTGNKTPILWLNPPYARIAPWAAKCAAYAGLGKVLMLTPASVGSRWFQQHVFGKARVLFLSPRLCFDGKAPYPKDLMLSVYGRRVQPGIETWDWLADKRVTL